MWLVLSLLLAATDPLAVGARLPALALVDQHDVAATIAPTTRLLLFARDMDADALAKQALADDGARLGAAQAVYVANISAMPSVITDLFALPAMRRRPYRMLLDRTGTATAMLPAEAGKLTVLTLRDLTIERVEFVDSPAAVRAALQAAAAAPQ